MYRSSSLKPDEVKRRLRELGCLFIRKGRGAKEIWRTPDGTRFPVLTREITQANLMLINQTLRAEKLEEIRPPAPEKRVTSDAVPPAAQLQIQIKPPEPKRAERLVDVLRRRLQAAIGRHRLRHAGPRT